MQKTTSVFPYFSLTNVAQLMIVQRFTIIKQVSHYSTKGHSLEPVENDAVSQKVQ